MLDMLDHTGMDTNGQYDDLIFPPIPGGYNGKKVFGIYNIGKLCDYFEGREVESW